MSHLGWIALASLTAGLTGCAGEGGDGPPPAVEVPPVYPKDGYCLDSGVAWAWCEDFDGQGVDGRAAFDPARSVIAMHSHSHMSMVGVACESTLEEGNSCAATVQGGSLFLNPEDSGFGMDVLRIEQPFDFTGREGRIHYRSNMKGHPRMHQAVHLSPMISNTMPDVRDLDPAANYAPAISLTFVGDGGWPFSVLVWKDGEVAEEQHVDGPLGIDLNTGAELYEVDVYVRRDHLRVLLNGQQVFDRPIQELGFERAYVYFSQLAYNPVKDGYPGEATNRFLWDDLAFDGPSLARNSLTPADKQEVLFRAWNKASCTVRGVAADGAVNTGPNGWLIHTWRAQLDIDAPPVTRADIQCVAFTPDPAPHGQPDIAEIEIHKPVLQ